MLQKVRRNVLISIPHKFFNWMEKTEFKFAIDMNLYYYFDTDIALRTTVFTCISPSQDLLIWFLPKNR